MMIIVPVAIEIGVYNGKPIELVVSDIIIVIFGLFGVIFIAQNFRTIRVDISVLVYVAMFFYMVITSIASGIVFDTLSPLVSVMRFLKSTLLIFFGVWLGFYVTPRLVINVIGNLTALLILVLLLSDVLFNPAFPFGRWGGNFFGASVYGFPNAAASFYALLGVFIVVTLRYQHGCVERVLLWAALGAMFVICLLSLSRNALLTYIAMLSLSYLWFHRIRLRVIATLALMIGGAIVFGADYLQQNEGLIHKLKAFSGDNPLSSRDEVWLFAIGHLAVSPVFGYGFYSFDHFGFDIGTLHNAFLDLIYKSGFAGMLVYIGTLSLPLIYRFNAIKANSDGSVRIFFDTYLMMLFLAFFSGITQESLSFSLVQSVLFFCLGLSVSFHRRFVKYENT